MERKIKACAIQFDTKTGEVDENLKYLFDKISSINADFAVLPEMWTCGFDYANLKIHAERTPEILQETAKIARDNKVVIAGSYPELSGSDIFNTSYILDRDGTMKGRYRKVHLFSKASENRYFKEGDSSVVTDTSIGKIGHIICYDLRFPELFRTLAINGAQIVAVMAQWPNMRIDHWKKLLEARAIENQLFVIGANRVGKENLLTYGGSSRIVSPMGESLDFLDDKEGIAMAEIDFKEMAEFRDKIPCFKERVKEVYRL